MVNTLINRCVCNYIIIRFKPWIKWLRRQQKYTHSLLKQKYRYLCKQRLVKVAVLTQLLYSSNKVQVLRCTRSIKVKGFPLKDNSTCNYKADWTSSQISIIQRLLKLQVELVGFVRVGPEHTRKLADCRVSFPECQLPTFWVDKASSAKPKKQKHSN